MPVVEARKHPRQSVRMSVEFQQGDQPRVAGSCRDLSLGGMFVETPSPAPFGSSVQVYVTFPALKGETVIQATVRWTSPEGMGVQFGVMGARETHALTELLRGAV